MLCKCVRVEDKACAPRSGGGLPCLGIFVGKISLEEFRNTTDFYKYLLDLKVFLFEMKVIEGLK